jgi:hypothetical protein
MNQFTTNEGRIIFFNELIPGFESDGEELGNIDDPDYE